MRTNFIERAEQLVRKPTSERKEVFLREMRAAQDAYIQCADMLNKQARMHESYARELDVLIKFVDQSGPVIEPKENPDVSDRE